MTTFTAYLNQPFQPNIVASDPGNTGVGLTYNWQQISGPGISIFSDPNILSPQITSPTPGIYVFQITVSDSITPVSLQISVNVLPLFTAAIPYTAYCPTGGTGTPSTVTGYASSATSQADANTKALSSGSYAANASLSCSEYLELPNLQINIFGVTQIDPSITEIQLSYLSAGTLANPITETVLNQLIVISPTNQPLAFYNTTICNPGNLLFPYSTQVNATTDEMISTLTGPINLIVRAGSNGVFNFPVALNLDFASTTGVSINSMAASSTVAAAPNAVITLPNNNPGLVNVSLQQGTFIGFDTSNWQPSSSPANYLLIYIPQGPLSGPTGLATVAAIPMGLPTVPALAEIVQIDTLLSHTQLESPIFLAFFAATFNAGTGVYTPIANSVQFTANSVFSASNSCPPGVLSPFNILSMTGVSNLNIPSASNGVLYIPAPGYARIVCGMSTIN